MIRLVAVCVVASLATLSGTYLHRRQIESDPAEQSKIEPVAEQSTLVFETELLAAPLISKGQLRGFFFLRLGYKLNPTKRIWAASPDLMIADGFYEFAGSLKSSPLDDLKELDVDAMISSIKGSVRQGGATPMFDEVFLLQLDYFDSDDVRKKSIERRLVLAEKSGDDRKTSETHPAPAH